MTHDVALKILHTYQKWRRGANIPMPEPKEIGEAIDVAIRALRGLRRSKRISASDRVIEGPLLKVEIIAGKVVSVEKVEDN